MSEGCRLPKAFHVRPEAELSQLLIAAAALGFLACGGEDPAGSADRNGFDLSRADSSVVDGWPSPVEPAEDRGFDVGQDTVEGTLPLFRVSDLLVRSDGGVYVANGGTNEILALDESGSILWRGGGEGEGPTEFLGLARLQSWPGDTVLAVDTRRNTVSFWTSSGEHVRTRTLGPVGPGGSGGVAFRMPGELMGILADQRFIVRGPGSAPRVGEPGMRRVRTPVNLAVHPDSGLRPLAELPGAWAYELRTPGQLPAMLAPMTAGTPVAVADSGFTWARTDRYEVVLFDVTGEPRRVLRVDEPREALAPSLRSDYREAWSPWFEVEEEIPFPTDSVPAFDRIFYATDGSLWARRFNFGAVSELQGAEDWLRFGADSGGAADRFRFPEDVRIKTASAYAAYGIRRDELDVEHLVRFTLSADGQ